ncbi:MAG: hypothetical protein KY444_11590, partial [Gemmatimonadetes bacterium]|nr:hypothetical protein [Gemmatimonadota bacterium]
GLGAGPNRASARTATASANVPFVVQAPVVPVTHERGAPPLPSATALSGAVADPPNPPPSTRSFPTPRPRDPASLPTAAAAPRPPSSPDPVRPLALGAYIRDAEWDPTAIDRFAGRVGAAPAIVMWYQDWAHPGHRDFSPAALDGVVARGAMPLITWEPFDYDGDADQPAYALRTILAGRHDAHIRQWARGAAAWGQPFYLRFAHEMNGNWYPWSPGVNGNTAAEYPAAWRHVVDLFRQEGAHNVRWVWSPNVAGGDSAPFAPLYPGDAYVDWVALDGYNWGTTRSGLTWTDLTAIFGASYDALTALTDRPLMIAETASAEAGGDKGAWITQGLLSELPARFPRVRAVVWFDFKLQTDWQIASSASSLTAFRTVATSSLYSGRLP